MTEAIENLETILRESPDTNINQELIAHLDGVDLSTVPKAVIAPFISKLRKLGFTINRAGKFSHSQLLKDLIASLKTPGVPDQSTIVQSTTHVSPPSDTLTTTNPSQGTTIANPPASEIAALSAKLVGLESSLNELGRALKRPRGQSQDLQQDHRTVFRSPDDLFGSSAVDVDQEFELGLASDPTTRGQQSANQPLDGRPFHLRTIPSHRPLKVPSRDGPDIYQDVLEQSVSVTAHVKTTTFKNIASEREAASIAHVVDSLVSQYGPAIITHADASEILLRRLVAVLHGDQTGDWQTANQMEVRPSNSSLGPVHLYANARQSALVRQRLQKSISSPHFDHWNQPQVGQNYWNHPQTGQKHGEKRTVQRETTDPAALRVTAPGHGRGR